MDFNEVSIFIKVIQKGSFSAAAMALNMPKSTVSTKISNLEKQLGLSLITRTTRKIRLTPAGEAFYLRSNKAIEEILAAESELKAETMAPQGRLRITAPVDIGNTLLPNLAVHFLKLYPRVNLEIVLTDQNVDFLDDEIDLALRAGKLKDSSLIAKKIGEVSFRLYASPKYLAEKKTPVTIADLKTHHGVFFASLWKDGWTLKSDKKSYQVKLAQKLVVNNMKMVHGLALEGAGIALLPTFFCEEDVKKGKLIPILKDVRSEIAPLHLVYPSQKYIPPAVRAFIELASGKFKSLLF